MDELIITDRGNVRFITLNRPESRNALNFSLMGKLASAIRQASADDGIKVIVVNSSSDRAFCAGVDLKELKDFIDSNRVRDYFRAYSEIILAIEDCIKPTVAVVKGYALAGGCGLAVACDITIASDDSKFGVPEINLGMWPMIISYPILKFVHPKKVLELFLTGRIIEASEAKDMGMVNFIVDKENIQSFSDEIINNLASRSSLALKMGKEAFDFLVQENYSEKIKYLREMSAILASSSRTNIEEFLTKSKK
ncbi:MAG: enoyl-CoA hydratase/isomerase family protein [Candidatus Calescibacterium sp.]|nr:enoyl-CoA hydratase/isomerase family protein [Candidatus Calescibacterium sp.]